MLKNQTFLPGLSTFEEDKTTTLAIGPPVPAYPRIHSVVLNTVLTPFITS